MIIVITIMRKRVQSLLDKDSVRQLELKLCNVSMHALAERQKLAHTCILLQNVMRVTNRGAPTASENLEHDAHGSTMSGRRRYAPFHATWTA